MSKFQKRHGMKGTPEYLAWENMRRRCKSNARYAGRGITVCKRWETFEHFFADMGPRPSPGHSLDRIDSNGNYEPGNCRWATFIEQQNNRPDNRRVIYRGQEMTVAEAARAAGNIVHRDRANARVCIGWSIEDAVEIPIGPIGGGAHNISAKSKRERAE